jgi:hypothetical protein
VNTLVATGQASKMFTVTTRQRPTATIVDPGYTIPRQIENDTPGYTRLELTATVEN